MKEKGIQFLGLNQKPYSDISEDGQLSLSDGVENYAGSIRPSVVEGTDYTLPSGDERKLVFVHSTSNYQHLIFYKDGSLSWADVGNVTSYTYFGTADNLKSVHSIGNTLIVLSENSMMYYIFKNNAYKTMGSKPPFCSISFGLRSVSAQTSEFRLANVDNWASHDSAVTTMIIRALKWILNYGQSPGSYSWKNEYEDAISGEAPDDNLVSDVNLVTNDINARIASIISEKSKDGKFFFPFFVRYAYRMYDSTGGMTHYMHSSPILMVPDSLPPAVILKSVSLMPTPWINMKIVSFPCDLDWQITGFYDAQTGNEIDSSTLQDWNDVIAGLDVYVSSPIYTYKPDGKVYGYSFIADNDIDTAYSNGTGLTAIDGIYKRRDFLTRYRNIEGKSLGKWMKLDLEYLEKEDISDKVRDLTGFYKIYSLDGVTSIIQQASKNREVMDLGEGVLSNLETHEQLEDDYDSLDLNVPGLAYSYNSRLNIANITSRLFTGYPPESMVAYSSDGGNMGRKDMRYLTVMDKQGQSISVLSPTSVVTEKPAYVFYPYNSCSGFNVYLDNGKASVSAAQHNFLNGCYVFAGLDGYDLTYTQTSENPENLATPDPVVRMANKLYISDVNNPFYFPLEGRNTIGASSIIAMASVAVPLAERQAGKFPLIVLCDDGNWALKVNDEGTYTGMYPGIRDVCVNAGSVCQTDGSIIFVSDRGAMNCDGNTIMSVAEALEGTEDSVPDDFTANGVHVSDIFRRCLTAYDYVGRRLLFLDTGSNVSLVLNLDSGTWSSAHFGTVKSVVNVYPYSYIQFSGSGKITKLDDTYRFSDTRHTGNLCTRAMKLDTYQLKKIWGISVQGVFSNPQELILYGSMDGMTWFKIGSSKRQRITGIRGRYFKYFRIGIKTDLKQNENITAIRIHYDVRSEQQLR